MPQTERRALFEEYLRKADELKNQPKWYNSLTSNCTTLVFDMGQAISKRHLPTDYRLFASGYLPNYLYDLNALSHDLTIKQWYEVAYINPRVSGLNNISSTQYSTLIRKGIPKPILQKSP